MFRILTTIGLIMAVSVPAFADEGEGSGMYLGAKIGPSVVMMLGEDADDLDPAPGMATGLMFKASLMDYLALQAEFLYEMKGFAGQNNGNDVRQFLHYLTVPVIVKGVFEVEPVSIEPYAGLALSLLVAADLEATVNGFDVSRSDTGDYNSIDLGVLFGGEIWVALDESFFLTGDIRFLFGVIDTVDGPNDNGFYNCAISLLLGAAYQF